MSLITHSIAGPVGRLRLTRSEQRNALSRQLVDEALQAIDDFTQARVTTALLEADPPVFCAGNDLDEMNPETAAAPQFLQALLTSPFFWIAVIDGPAYGAGVAAVACCPVALATQQAAFELPEWGLGLFPAPVVGHLEVVMGARAAFTAGLSGSPITATDAARCGLVTETLAAHDVESRVQYWVERVAKNPQAAAAARRAWQGRFRDSPQRDRLTELDENMRSQLAVWQWQEPSMADAR